MEDCWMDHCLPACLHRSAFPRRIVLSILLMLLAGAFPRAAHAQTADGKSPVGALAFAPDGYFYGTTSAGETGGYGSVFRMDTAGNVTVLHAFTGADGSLPWSGLAITGVSGSLTFYGTTRNGGANGYGTLFKIVQSGASFVFTRLYSFTGANDGANPYARPLLVGTNDLYGTTAYGGAHAYGTVFDYNVSTNTLTTLYAFAGGTDGATPVNSLLPSTDGSGHPIYYGVTQYGGSGTGSGNGNGTLFKLDASNIKTILHTFNATTDGMFAASNLLLSANGNLYGTCYRGGASNNGTLWKCSVGATPTFTTLHSFAGGTTDGANPGGGVVSLVSGGTTYYYGSTQYGGSANNGAVYRWDGTTYTSSYTFTGPDGAQPVGELVADSSSLLWGVAYNGGAYGFGTAYKMVTGYLPMHSFGGSLPTAGISLAQSTVIQQTSVSGTVTLTAAAPTNGIVVTLSSDNAAASVPATVTVTAGTSSAGFTVTTSIVAASVTAHITATCNLVTSPAASLTIVPVGVIGLAFDKNPVTGTLLPTGTVTLNAAAPAGGATVTLTSQNSAATVPASITVPAGSNTAAFIVTTTAVTSSTSGTITAAYAGTSKSANLTVNPSPTLASVSVQPTSVVGGASSQGTVTLTGLAPKGGMVVALSSSGSGVSVPASVPVYEGTSNATFSITTVPVATSTMATLTATLGANHPTATLTVTAPVPTLALAPTSVIGTDGSVGTITLTGPAPMTGQTYMLTGQQAGVVNFPSMVTVASGATSATFNITTSAVATSTSATITANNGTSNLQATLTITALPTPIALSLDATQLITTESTTGHVTLSGPAPQGSTVIQLSASPASAVTIPASVTIMGGATTATFPVTANTVASSTVCTITASYGGASKAAALTVNPLPTLTGVTFTPSSVTGTLTSAAAFTLSGPAAASGAIVTLSSNVTGVSFSPASVTVAGGGTGGSFTINTPSVASITTANITLTYNGTLVKPLTINPPPTVASFSISPSPVIGGSASTGTITLTGPAPSAGTIVPLTLNQPGTGITIPASVTVLAYTSSVSFQIMTSPVSTALTASITEGNSLTSFLTVNPPPLLVLALSPLSVVGGGQATLTVSIGGPAPAGGLNVNLTSSDPSVPLPSTGYVTIAAMATSVTYAITTLPVSSVVNAILTASLAGSANQTIGLTVNPLTISTFTVTPGSLVGSSVNTANATVTLSDVALTDTIVNISSDNAVASLSSATVKILANTKQNSFTINTAAVSTAVNVTVSASIANSTKTSLLLVTPPTILSFTFDHSSITGGLPNPAQGTIKLSDPAPVGGALVSLVQNMPGIIMPGIVSVAAGSTTATFTVMSAIPVNTATTFQVTASYGGSQIFAGSSRTAALIVNPPIVQSITFSPSEVIGGPNGQVRGTITLNAPAPQSNGASVVLTASMTNPPNAALIPVSVSVFANQTSADFMFQTATVNVKQTVNITGTYAGTSATGPLIIDPLPTVASVTFAKNQIAGTNGTEATIAGGNNIIATVTLTNPPPLGASVVVTLSNSNPTGAILPSLLQVDSAGRATFLIGTNATDKLIASTIMANINNTSASGVLHISPGSANILAPVEDASVQAGANAGSNFGKQPYLLVDNPLTGVNQYATDVAYLMLDLTGYTAAPSCATLVLSQTADAPGFPLVAVYDVPNKMPNTNTDWSEGTLIWNNAPGLSNGATTGTKIADSLVAGNPLGTSTTSTVCFDLTAYVRQHLGKRVTLQIMDENLGIGNYALSFLSKESATGKPELIVGMSSLYARPAPFWALDAVPTNSLAGGGAGPSAADSVDLSSGVEQNQPGPDIVVYNSDGPAVPYVRMYRSALAASGYNSPGLTPGWVDNFDIEIVVTPELPLGPYMLRYPNGAIDMLSVAGAGPGNGTYMLAAPAGAPYVASSSSTGFTVTFRDQMQWNFSSFGNGVFLLSSVSNNLGEGYTIARDPVTHLINSITDLRTVNSLLQFSYQNGLLSSLIESAPAPDNTHRQVDFTYGAGNTDLATVSTIHYSGQQSSPGLVAGPRWSYGYSSVNGLNHLLTTVGVPDLTLKAPGGILQHSISYNQDGTVNALIDAKNNQHKYTYTSGSTRIDVTAASGQTLKSSTQNLTSSSGLMIDAGATDGNSHTDQVVYNDARLNPYSPTSYTEANQANTQATYTPTYGDVATITDPLNNLATFTYVQPSAYAPQIVSTVKVSGQQDPNGTAYFYDLHNFLSSITTPGPGSGPRGYTAFSYTTLGNIAGITQPDAITPNGQSVYNYGYVGDGTGILQESINEPLVVVDPNGNQTHYRYDYRGNLVTVIDALNNQTDYAYNEADQVTTETYPAAALGAGRCHLQYTYYYTGGPVARTDFYDENGILFRSSSAASGSEGEATASTGGDTTQGSTYDSDLEANGLIDGNNNQTVFTYDNAGNVTGLTYPKSDQVTATYDAADNPSTYVNGGISTSYAYKPLTDLLTDVNYSSDNSLNVHIVSDQFGRPSTVTDRSGINTYSYDDLGNVGLVTTTFGPAATPMHSSVQYGYARNGNRTSMTLTLPNGTFTYSYGYDSAGNQTSMILPWNQTINYKYDVDNRLTQKSQVILTPPTLLSTNITYDGRGLVSELKTVFGSINPNDPRQLNVSDFQMAYRATGNLASTNFVAIGDSGNIAYTYNDQLNGAKPSDAGLDQLARETRTGSVVAEDNSYTYDADLNRITNYDFIHNLRYNWNADADNQYSPEQYDARGNTTFAYVPGWFGPSIGGQAQAFTYDAENRMTRSEFDIGNNQAVALMTYGADGLRASKSVQPDAHQPPFMTYFVYDNDILLAEVSVQSNVLLSTRLYGYGADGLDQTATYNPQGTLIQYTAYTFTPQGTLVSRYRSQGVSQYAPYDYAAYDSYGNQLIASLGVDNGPKEFRNDPGYDPVGFCGQWGCYTDVETGLILMGHRYYNPVTGRFMTRDPISYEGGINLYAYCGNNPLTGIDPTGLTEKSRFKRIMDWLFGYMEAKATSDAAGLNVDPNFGVPEPTGEDGRPLQPGGPIYSPPRKLPKRPGGGSDRSVTDVPLDKITPLHPVPRPGMPANHIDNLANNIKANGYDVDQAIPIVRMPDGKLISFGGHHRVAAMRQLGETTIPGRITDWNSLSKGARLRWQKRFPDAFR